MPRETASIRQASTALRCTHEDILRMIERGELAGAQVDDELRVTTRSLQAKIASDLTGTERRESLLPYIATDPCSAYVTTYDAGMGKAIAALRKLEGVPAEAIEKAIADLDATREEEYRTYALSKRSTAQEDADEGQPGSS